MTLRKKTLLFFTAGMAGLLAVVYFPSRAALLAGFGKVERDAMVTNSHRLQDALKEEADNLGTKLSDWAVWDDTYKFIVDRNQAYVESNLTMQTLDNLNLDLLLFINTKGEIVYATGGREDRRQFCCVNPASLDQIVKDPKLGLHTSEDSAISGVAALVDGLWLIASRAIVQSSGEGPVRGTIVMARRLGVEEIRGLARRTHLGVDIRPLDGRRLPVDFKAVWREALNAKGPVVHPLSESQIAAYQLIGDVNGRPVLIARATTPRTIYMQAKTTLSLFLLALLTAGLLYVLLAVWLLEKLILRRLARLSRSVERITRTCNERRRVDVTGSDELGNMGATINRMLETIQESVQQLKASEEKTRLIVETAMDAVIAMEADGTISGWNRQAERIFGWAREEVIGRSLCETIVPPELREAHKAGLKRCLETGCIEVLAQRLEVKALRKNGQQFPAELCVTPVFSRGSVVFNGFVRDITERKRYEQELAAARDAALQTAELKAKFLANMSHEIRTPMNGVMGMTDLLLETDLTLEQADYVATIKSSAEALLTIINDILDFSKIEAKKVVIESAPFSVARIVETVADLLSRPCADKGLELVTDVADELAPAVMGDAVRVRQVLTNLLGNAVKFTDTGEIVVRARLVEEEDEKPPRVRLEVQDTGIGIPADRLDSVFESFEQADGTTTRKYGGTGLGLTICRHLAELMGGGVGVESEVGKGSLFWFEFPYVEAVGGAVESTGAGGELDGVRVVIADESETVCELLSRYLRAWGCRPERAASLGEAALILHGAEARSAVLVDAGLASRAEESERKAMADQALNPHVSVILMCPVGAKASEKEKVAVGAKVLLTKPVRVSSLLDALMQTLGRPERREKVEAEKKAADFSAEREVRVLLVEDNAVNRKLATKMLERLGCLIETAENGKQALELSEHGHHHIILMDVQMPEMDGLTATHWIRERERVTGKHIPIIALTAHAMAGDREKCLLAGMDDYITKPVRQDDLAEKIEKWTRPAVGKAA